MQYGNRRRSDLWVDDNRDGLAWGEVVDVVESGVRKGRKGRERGRLRLGSWTAKLRERGTRNSHTGDQVEYVTGRGLGCNQPYYFGRHSTQHQQDPRLPGNLGKARDGGKMTGASGQSAPGPVAEDVPQAPKKPALHQRGPSFQSASFCLVLSNQQITSNQSAVGLVYASQFQVWPSLHAGSPGHLAYPSRLTSASH